jgi:hypothetical protein
LNLTGNSALHQFAIKDERSAPAFATACHKFTGPGGGTGLAPGQSGI